MKSMLRLKPLYWLALGILATGIFDLLGVLRAVAFDTSLPDYALVGRWVSYFSDGQFTHESIRRSPPRVGEAAIGWVTHYAVGIFYAGFFSFLVGRKWQTRPTFLPPLLFGLATVVAPFLVMQPAMGAGMAAELTADPVAARLRSLTNHALFGVALFLSGLLLAVIEFRRPSNA